jgi:hypothetical protein
MPIPNTTSLNLNRCAMRPRNRLDKRPALNIRRHEWGKSDDSRTDVRKPSAGQCPIQHIPRVAEKSAIRAFPLSQPKGCARVSMSGRAVAALYGRVSEFRRSTRLCPAERLCGGFHIQQRTQSPQKGWFK